MTRNHPKCNLINEELRSGDLRGLVDPIVEIDSYKSKMGEDNEIAVLAFIVLQKSPAVDLENFIERGYSFVLDADVSPGELDDGKYKVFVEIERNRKIDDQILELMSGVSKLVGDTNFKFRYYKSFHTMPFTKEELKIVPKTKPEYTQRIKEFELHNFSNFFDRSYVESIDMENDELIFRKKFAEPLRMKLKMFGPSYKINENISSLPIMEFSNFSEILFLTKYIGDYNISKRGNYFVFENKGHTLVLERK